MKKVLTLIILLTTTIAILYGCTYQTENYVFGTYYSVKIEGKNANKIGREIDDLFKDIDVALSTNIIDSDVSKINRAKANQPIKVNDITASIFKLSKLLHEETDGAFNPATFPLTELWCFSPSTFTGYVSNIPTGTQIKSTLEYCDFNLFILDETTSSITKLHDKAKIDFGAIAKGYAADLAYALVKDQSSAIIDVGRTYKVLGEIRLYVAHPRGEDFVASATLSNQCVATSGDYERYYIVDDKRYHHIISTDGYPAGINDKAPIISATVIGDCAAICDALSTATMILGYEKSKIILEKYGYSALLLTENGYYTIGETLFEITDQTKTKLN